MGLFRSSGRFVVRLAKHAAGGEAIRIGFTIMSSQAVKTFKGKPCPKCRAGTMYRFDQEGPDGRTERYRGCDECDHYEAWDAEKDADSLARLQAIVQRDLFSDPKACEKRMRSMKIESRAWYVFFIACFIYAGYTVASGGRWVIFACAMGGAAFMFAKGYAAAYRHWQVQTKTVFVPGSFKQWFRLGKWLV